MVQIIRACPFFGVGFLGENDELPIASGECPGGCTQSPAECFALRRVGRQDGAAPHSSVAVNPAPPQKCLSGL
jgi:hypothetical protein